MGIDIIPLPYVCVPLDVCSQITLPVVFTKSSVDAPVDIHDPSHNFPFFYPWEASLVGHQVTALPSCSCGVISSSPPKEVVLQGVGTGTPLPCMMVAHTQGNANLWHDEKKLVSVEDLWPSVLVHHFVRGHVSHNLLWHPPKSSSSHLSLIFLFPFQASTFTSTQVARFQIHSAYFSVIVPLFVSMPLQSIGPVPPSGCSLISLSQMLCRYPLSWQKASLMGALLLPTVGKTKLTGSLGHHPNIK